MISKVEVHQQTTEFQGFFRLERFELSHELFAGGMSPTIARELLERGDAVSVLPYDPRRDEVVLIEQFRIGALRHDWTSTWLTEIVAGVFDAGETPEEVAKRETKEEAGLTIEAIEPICRYLVSPGGTSEAIHLFCAKVDTSKAGGVFGIAAEGEDIRVEVVAAAQAFAMVAEGRINSASPLIALQWLQMNRDKLQKKWA